MRRTIGNGTHNPRWSSMFYWYNVIRLLVNFSNHAKELLYKVFFTLSLVPQTKCYFLHLTFHLQATQPQLFLDFIDQLLDIVSKVNGGIDRLLRGMACECLKEIETLHPVSVTIRSERMQMQISPNMNIFWLILIYFCT